jgi:hypothetical protein
MEGVVPDALRGLRLEAELEGDAAEDERDQHDEERHVERRQQDRVGEIEDSEEPAAAQDEPGLVAVPDRRDGEHHPVAPILRPRGREEDADAEIEAVGHDVHGDRNGEEPRPDEREPEGGPDGLRRSERGDEVEHLTLLTASAACGSRDRPRRIRPYSAGSVREPGRPSMDSSG